MGIWRERRAVLITAALLLLVLVIIFAGASAAIAVPRLVLEGLFLLLWLAAAGGYGSVVFPRGERSILRSVSILAIGLGILGLLQLLLGVVGLLHRWTAFAVIGVGIALLAFRHRHLSRSDVVAWLTGPADWDWLWLLAMPALAMALVEELVPPGVLWGDEPHGYDVLEYHLQLPREFYELGRIVPLHHNVFSYFPLGMEMHYLLAMQLRGGPWAGMYLAQLMHVAVTALAVVATYAAARQLAGKGMATLAAVAVANIPWLGLLAPVAYNEGALILFTTLAVAWAVRDEPRDWLIGGVMAGFACGVKLTAVPQVLLLVPLAAALVNHRRFIPKVATFIAAGVVVFSPWLIRNLVSTRNPVFPEAQSLFGRAHFSETQQKRWHDAHSPTAAQQSITARARAGWEQIAADWRYGYLLIPVGLACVVVSIQRSAAKVLLIILFGWLTFWFALTHLQGRFFVTVIPLAAMALALMQTRRQLVFGYFAATLAILIGLTIQVVTFTERVGMWRDRQWLAVEDFKQFLAEDVADLVEKKHEIVLVGDARAFWYPLPTSKLRYRTIFDVTTWHRDESAYTVVDPVEVERFSKTYFGVPPLPPNLQGPRDHAFVIPPLTNEWGH